MGLVVNKHFHGQPVAELVTLVKANPGKIDFDYIGAGGNPEIWAVVFKNIAGTKLRTSRTRAAATRIRTCSPAACR